MQREPILGVAAPRTKAGGEACRWRGGSTTLRACVGGGRRCWFGLHGTWTQERAPPTTCGAGLNCPGDNDLVPPGDTTALRLARQVGLLLEAPRWAAKGAGRKGDTARAAAPRFRTGLAKGMEAKTPLRVGTATDGDNAL